MIVKEDFTVIVRSSEERTTNLCKDLLEKYFEKSSVFLVKEKPFTESIKESFRVGIEKGRKWTFCVDADVLIDPTNLDNAVMKLAGLHPKAFVMQALVMDKFFGVYRPAGNHFYRTSLLPEALRYIDQYEESLRPESDLINHMMRLGLPWVQIENVLGTHDFEQYYKDIFRKCHLQAHKHRHLFYLLAKRWKNLAVRDKDFQIAYWGLYTGLAHMESVKVDRDIVNNEFEELKELKGINEKLELSIENIILLDHDTADEDLQELIFPKVRWNTTNEYKPERFKKIVFHLGYLIEILGKKIKKFVD